MIHFHFSPFSKLAEVQMLIFVTFLIGYLISIGSNAFISLILWVTHCLHCPVYFFLASVAALEICYSSTAAPLTLVSSLSTERTLISLLGRGAQMFFAFLGSTDCILLALMAYASDLRYRSLPRQAGNSTVAQPMPSLQSCEIS